MFATLILVMPARAQRLLDYNYAFQSRRQRAPLRRIVRHILSPTVSAVAIGVPGGTIVVDVRLPDNAAMVSGAVEQWHVFLLNKVSGLKLRAPVKWLRRIGNRVRVGVQVPAKLARDVYDLRLVTQGIDDTQANAVRIARRAVSKDTFRFAVVSDHQLWDPSFQTYGPANKFGSLSQIQR